LRREGRKKYLVRKEELAVVAPICVGKTFSPHAIIFLFIFVVLDRWATRWCGVFK